MSNLAVVYANKPFQKIVYAKAVPEVLSDGNFIFACEDVVDFWWQILCQFSQEEWA